MKLLLLAALLVSAWLTYALLKAGMSQESAPASWREALDVDYV